MSGQLRNFALWIIIVILLLALFTLFQNPGRRVTSLDITYSQLVNDIDAGRVRDVQIQGAELYGTWTDGRMFFTYLPNDPTFLPLLRAKSVTVSAQPTADAVPWFASLLVSWLPFIALIGVWIFLSRQMSGASNAASHASRAEVDALKRQIADMQAQIDRLRVGDK